MSHNAYMAFIVAYILISQHYESLNMEIFAGLYDGETCKGISSWVFFIKKYDKI